MTEVGIRELKQNASEILRRVREDKETIEVSYRGKVIARIVPVKVDEDRERTLQVWREMDALAKQITAKWPKGVSAADAVAEQRR